MAASTWALMSSAAWFARAAHGLGGSEGLKIRQFFSSHTGRMTHALTTVHSFDTLGVLWSGVRVTFVPSRTSGQSM